MRSILSPEAGLEAMFSVAATVAATMRRFECHGKEPPREVGVNNANEEMSRLGKFGSGRRGRVGEVR